jgi:hypothetical protein
MRVFDQSLVHEVECGCADGVVVSGIEGGKVEMEEDDDNEEEEAGGVENERGG